MSNGTDRGIKVYHAEKSREKWVAYVIRDISAFVTDDTDFKRGLDEILRSDGHIPSEWHNHAIFAVGTYSSTLQKKIKDYLTRVPPNIVEIKEGDYFTLHRYTIMSELDSEVSEARQ